MAQLLAWLLRSKHLLLRRRFYNFLILVAESGELNSTHRQRWLDIEGDGAAAFTTASMQASWVGSPLLKRFSIVAEAGEPNHPRRQRRLPSHGISATAPMKPWLVDCFILTELFGFTFLLK